ncbi:MAG: VOC family protein [Alphaproteobacteria bacterium]|nr:VOC family protein [Alphaproteobacteria bacterium]
MIAYSMLGSNDFDKARKFYGALLADLGAKEMMVRPDGGAVFFGTEQGPPMFALVKPHDGKEASSGNGVMVAFAAKDPAQVKSLYDKAITLGATCDGEPGPRLDGMVSCGYVRDFDGNKLNFFCMGS